MPVPLPLPHPALPASRTGVATTEAVPPASRPLGFNCPACGVVLIIHNPAAYDGEPAPCPHCAVAVLPPRVCLPSADSIDLHPLPGLSDRGSLRSKTPRPVHRPDRHVHASSQGDRSGVVLSGSL